LLFKTGLRVMRDYEQQRKEGIETPVFDASKFSDLNIDPAAWDQLPTQQDAADQYAANDTAKATS